MGGIKIVWKKEFVFMRETFKDIKLLWYWKMSKFSHYVN